MTLTQDLMRMWWMQQQGGEPPVPVDPYTEKVAIAGSDAGHVNGKSYFDTGLTHTINDVWEVTAMNISAQSRSPIGTGKAKDDGSNFALWLHGEKSPKYAEFVFGYGSKDAYRLNVNIDVAQPHTYKMKLSTGEAWIDGEAVGQASSVGALGTSTKLVIYACWRGSNTVSDFYQEKMRRGENLEK